MKKGLIFKILEILSSTFFYLGIMVSVIIILNIFFEIYFINNLIGDFSKLFGEVWYINIVQALGIFIPLFFVIYISYEVKKLFNNLKGQEVFSKENSKQIKKISILLILNSILHLSIPLILVSLVILSFSEIFDYGVEIEEEKKLTI